MSVNELVPLSRISHTEATITDEQQVLAIYWGLLRGHYPDWLYYHSDKLDYVEDLATMFVNRHSIIKDDESQTLYSPTPIEVFRHKYVDGNDEGEIVHTLLEGLLYLNGAVILLHRSDRERPIVLLWVARKTADTFTYPMPL